MTLKEIATALLTQPVSFGDEQVTLDDSTGFKNNGAGSIDGYFFSWETVNGNTLEGCKCIQIAHANGVVVKQEDVTGIKNYLHLKEMSNKDEVHKLLSRYKNSSTSAYLVKATQYFNLRDNDEDLKSFRTSGEKYTIGIKVLADLRNEWLSNIYDYNTHIPIGTSTVNSYQAGELTLSDASDFSNKGDGLIDLEINPGSIPFVTKPEYFSWRSKSVNTLKGCNISSDPNSGEVVRQLNPFETADPSQIFIPIDLKASDIKDNTPPLAGYSKIGPGMLVTKKGSDKRVSIKPGRVLVNRGSSAFGIYGITQYYGKIERDFSFGISMEDFKELLEETSYNAFAPICNDAGSNITHLIWACLLNIIRFDNLNPTPPDSRDNKGVKHALEAHADACLGANLLEDGKTTAVNLDSKSILQFQGKIGDSVMKNHLLQPFASHIINNHSNFINDSLAEIYPSGNMISRGEVITVDGKQFRFLGVHQAKMEVYKPNGVQMKFYAVEPSGGIFDEWRWGWGDNYIYDSKSDSVSEYGGHWRTDQSSRTNRTTLTATSTMVAHFNIYSHDFSHTEKVKLCQTAKFVYLGTDTSWETGYNGYDFANGNDWVDGLKMYSGYIKIVSSGEIEKVGYHTIHDFLGIDYASLGEDEDEAEAAEYLAEKYSMRDILDCKNSFITDWNSQTTDFGCPPPLNSEFTSIGESGHFVVRINQRLRRYNFPHNIADELSFSEETRLGVIELKKLMFDMNSDLCRLLEIVDQNDNYNCTLVTNPCPGDCGCYTWGCWLFDTQTASESIQVQPLDWLGLEQAFNAQSDINPFETFTHGSVVSGQFEFTDSTQFMIPSTVSEPRLDFVVKPGWKIHLQLDGFVNGVHKNGYFLKDGLETESASEFIVLRGGDRLSVGYWYVSQHITNDWSVDNVTDDELAILIQTKQQAEHGGGNTCTIFPYYGNHTDLRQIRITVSSISRPFCTPVVELPAAWGAEAGIGTLATIIRSCKDNMQLSAYGMFGISLTWQYLIELNVKTYFKLDCNLFDYQEPVTFSYETRGGFAAGQDLDIGIKFSSEISLSPGIKFEIPRRNWNYALNYIIYQMFKSLAMTWLVDEPRKPRNYSEVVVSIFYSKKWELDVPVWKLKGELNKTFDASTVTKIEFKGETKAGNFPIISMGEWTPDDSYYSLGVDTFARLNKLGDWGVTNGASICGEFFAAQSNNIVGNMEDAKRSMRLKVKNSRILKKKFTTFIGADYQIEDVTWVQGNPPSTKNHTEIFDELSILDGTNSYPLTTIDVSRPSQIMAPPLQMNVQGIIFPISVKGARIECGAGVEASLFPIPLGYGFNLVTRFAIGANISITPPILTQGGSP